MATVKYRVKSKKPKASIYLKLSIDRRRVFEKKTGLQIDFNRWSNETNMPKQGDAINKALASKLRKLENHVLDNLNEAEASGKTVSSNWLGFQIDVHFDRVSITGKSELITDIIKNIIRTADTRKGRNSTIGLSKTRVCDFNALLRKFTEFDGEGIAKAKDIDMDFCDRFLSFLLKKKKYSMGYALKIMANLKTVCYDAETRGMKISPQLKKVPSGRVKNDFIIFLDPSELQKIEKANILRPRLINARKWLLLGCNIGQRGGDLLKINQNNFVTRDGLETIELTQQKTGKQVTIPVLKKTREILKDGLPYKISLQRLNNYIKDVCEIAEIDQPIEGRKKDKKTNRYVTGIYPKYKLITTHCLRRSFSTNNYGVLPTPLIIQVTGHSTEHTFLGYIGKSPYQYAKQIADFYESQALKNKKEPKLTVIKNDAKQSNT